MAALDVRTVGRPSRRASIDSLRSFLTRVWRFGAPYAAKVAGLQVASSELARRLDALGGALGFSDVHLPLGLSILEDFRCQTVAKIYATHPRPKTNEPLSRSTSSWLCASRKPSESSLCHRKGRPRSLTGQRHRCNAHGQIALECQELLTGLRTTPATQHGKAHPRYRISGQPLFRKKQKRPLRAPTHGGQKKKHLLGRTDHPRPPPNN